jgi:hypothetical protein
MKRFYKEFQDYITPAGLSFFQSDWDISLTDFFHKTLSKSHQICFKIHSLLLHNFLKRRYERTDL